MSVPLGDPTSSRDLQASNNSSGLPIKFDLDQSDSIATAITERPDWGIQYTDSERLGELGESDLLRAVNDSPLGTAIERKVPTKRFHDSRKKREKQARIDAAKKQRRSCCCLIQ